MTTTELILTVTFALMIVCYLFNYWARRVMKQPTTMEDGRDIVPMIVFFISMVLGIGSFITNFVFTLMWALN